MTVAITVYSCWFCDRDMRVWTVVSLAIGGAAVLIAALAWLAERRQDGLASTAIAADPGALPAVDVGLVLGAAPIGPEGTPNRYFEYRLDAAAALWRSRRIKYLLASGAKWAPNHDEPTAMRDGLVRRGVPADAIYRDFAGLRTRDSIVRARNVFGQTRLIIVSQRFHLARAIFLARAEGIEVWGLEARDVDSPYSVFTILRRYPSAVVAYLDVWFDTPPRHAGPPIRIGVDPAN